MSRHSCRRIYCVDMGNTRTHCAIVEASKDGSFACVDSADYQTSNFTDVFKGEKLLEKSGTELLAWCSVVPSKAAELEPFLPESAMRLTCLNCPIKMESRNPAQVGQDRMADVVGASLFFKPPYIVVDMGTAVTIDLVDARGVYSGGVIAPGMHAFTSYLSERAAQLPAINPSEIDYDIIVGKDTKEAMGVGCVRGFCKLADGIIADIGEKYFSGIGIDINSRTIFTGGSVGLLPKKWLAERKIECNLAHLGLAKSYILNESKK